ncbi:uncharacterized protein DS421_19g656180 [Arachis hypogaea]|uniref:Uncharacterized protein n=1 Tax=Arachis hypogaea TaxID=3818 RepID=A0A6B9V9X5_ARAHY|nr:uncharacterized protein DS421_19g656180 [Arachis hypogaea]
MKQKGKWGEGQTKKEGRKRGGRSVAGASGFTTAVASPSLDLRVVTAPLLSREPPPRFVAAIRPQPHRVLVRPPLLPCPLTTLLLSPIKPPQRGREGELASEVGRRCSFAAAGEENTSGKGNRGKRCTKGAVTGKESTCVTVGEREIGTSAAAGQGSCVSVILTAGSGSVTFGTTVGASGYFCRHQKTLPVRALNLVFIRLRFRKLYRLCMWVSVTNAGVRSPLSLEVADALPPNRFKRLSLFGSAVPSSWLGTEVLVAVNSG